MAGGERGRLVEEEELGVALAPHVAPAVLERADADNPVLRRPAAAASVSVVAMQPAAAIAHRAAALGDSVKVAKRIDAILQRPATVAPGARLRTGELCALACASPTVSTP